MADLSDEDLRAIAISTGGAPHTPFRTMRAIIAADRALNAAPSVGAEGLPPSVAMPSPWDVCYLWREPTGLHRSFSANHYNGRPCDDQVLLYTAAEVREYGDARERAALASRPAVDADTFTLDDLADACMLAELPDSKYESLCIALAARHPAQREGE